MKTIETEQGFRVTPVGSMQTTRNIENGHGGNKPLPVVDLQDNMVLSGWILPRRALKAWLRSPHVLQLVQGPDGSLSMSVMPIVVVKEN